jgi:hypothetical protein
LNLDGKPLDHVELQIPPCLATPLTLTAADVGLETTTVLIGDASLLGTTTYLLSVGEASLNKLVWERVFPEGRETNRYRNGQIDLRPGGLILYADVNLGLRRQRMGLLMRQEEGGLSLSPGGVILKGEVYAMPASRSLVRLLLPSGRQVQRALYALTVVGPLPGEARVEAVRFHDDRLEVMAQATYPAPAPPDTGWQPLEEGLELREIDVASGTARSGERLLIVRLDPRQLQIRVQYDPTNPKTISAWGERLDALLVVNGSYFAPEGERGYETIGMLISDGQRWGTPLRDYAGMLAVTSAGEVSVRWLRQRPYQPGEPLAQAMQSFPVLVTPGGVLGFPADADDGAPARRTAVAQDAEGNILLMVAPRGALSLHELAVFLTESDLRIDAALNLDGGGSTGLWLRADTAQIRVDSFTSVPSVITVERR